MFFLLCGTLFTTLFNSPCLKPEALANFKRERESLPSHQIDHILAKGFELMERTELIETLSQGGAALFPHVNIVQCGDQIAAVAYASLIASQRTGKQQILLLAPLHPLTEELHEARRREWQGHDLSQDPS